MVTEVDLLHILDGQDIIVTQSQADAFKSQGILNGYKVNEEIAKGNEGRYKTDEEWRRLGVL